MISIHLKDFASNKGHDINNNDGEEKNIKTEIIEKIPINLRENYYNSTKERKREKSSAV